MVSVPFGDVKAILVPLTLKFCSPAVYTENVSSEENPKYVFNGFSPLWYM